MGAFHAAGGKPDEIEAETRIERIGERIQLFAEEPLDDGGLAGGHTHFNGDAAHRAIGTEEHGFKAARPFAALFQNVRQSGGQGFERGADHLFGGDGFGEALLLPVIGQRQARRERLCAMAQGRIEGCDHAGAKARRHLRAFAAGHLPHRFEAGAAEGVGGYVIKVEGRDGKRRYHLGFFAGGYDGAIAVAGEGARRNRGSGHGAAHGKALGLQALADPVEQRLLATEEMGRTGHIQQKATRAIERHVRGEAVAPVGDAGEQFQIIGFVCRHNLQRRQHGARIGQRLADGKTQRGGLAVHGGKTQRIVHLGHNHQGRRFRGLPLAAPLQPVGRKARKPQRHDPFP